MEGFLGRERVGAQYDQRGADGCQRVLPVYALGGTDRAAAPAAEAVVPGQRAGADAEGIYAAGADGGEAGEKPAVADYAEHLRDRDPDFGTAVSDSGGAAHRAGHGGLQGEKQGCADPERTEADADAVCEGEGDPVGPGFCHKKRPACRPVERMARDEKALPAGGRQCQEGVPAQSAASLCRDLLPAAEGFGETRRHPGPFQHRNHPDLRDGIGGGTPADDQCAASDAVKANRYRIMTYGLTPQNLRFVVFCVLFTHSFTNFFRFFAPIIALKAEKGKMKIKIWHNK